MSGESEPTVTERRFEDRETLAGALADSVADSLRGAVEERGAASLVVSGGSTPRPFFAALRAQFLAWEKVTITLADDRWVPADHPRSNEGMVRRELLTDAAAAASLVGLVSDVSTPEAGLAAAQRRLEGLPRPFDVVVLGMGTDGHTASLFPGAAATAGALSPESPELCVAVRPGGELEPRISLTLTALVDSRRLLLHITGEDKWSVYRNAREGSAAGELPVGVLMRRAPAVEVYWSS